ncbi:myb-like protein L [Pistacia vera]|uniref:myb-like protein L n=1 Tax=Pistacia vera TaxID=55513 RepID=UPI0012631130|nr:myb-like protein L [Pistacia vera]
MFSVSAVQPDVFELLNLFLSFFSLEFSGQNTYKEDKNLLLIIQEKGISNWFDISVSLGTNRTPFQCLARYQRSLNASILKGEWTEDEDEQLCLAVEVFGETMRVTGNVWKKTLHPTRQRIGRWTPDEDKRLTVATILFGPKNWKKIAQFVPGRTQVQCRERWVNSLDPSVNRGEWTEEDDLMLEAALEEHGYSWSKVAAALPGRTDNQCWRYEVVGFYI